INDLALNLHWVLVGQPDRLCHLVARIEAEAGEDGDHPYQQDNSNPSFHFLLVSGLVGFWLADLLFLHLLSYPKNEVMKAIDVRRDVDLDVVLVESDRDVRAVSSCFGVGDRPIKAG